MSAEAPAQLIAALAAGTVELVDLTQPLSEQTVVMRVPAPFVNTRPLRMTEISRYDDRGKRWYWNDLELGEHIGTHVDAPVHWVSGQDGHDIASVPLEQLVGPAVVLDCTAQVADDPNYLVDLDHLQAFEAEIGGFPAGGWLLVHSGWDRRAGSAAEFLNNAGGMPQTPGMAPGAARYLADSPLMGIGVETVGTDAGLSPTFDPPTPVHHHMLGAGKCGVTSLTNLDRLPTVGVMVVVAPLRLVNGSGSPARVIAFVPSEARPSR
ncbi:MAG: cyclase family protein [Actinobacteria bacterium]|jgi:kynurenine formamidase|nr:cyclase family protein [Actinomycetota bacterium]